MRTTVDIMDPLDRELRAQAARLGITFKDALNRVIAADEPRTSEYKHIVLNDKDRPVIEGTRLKVRGLVAAHQAHGWSAEELAWQFQGITLAQVHGALAYYYDHQAEIDEDNRRVGEFVEEFRKRQQNDPVVQGLAQRMRELKASRTR